MLSSSLLHSDSASPWLRGFLLAAASDIAYDDDAALRSSRAAAFGLEEVGFIQHRGQWALLVDTEASILIGDDVLIIAFRGSETQFGGSGSLLDWLNDLEVKQKPYQGTKVHQGIARATNVALASVVRCIRQHGAGRQLWLCGHSLGGAVAQLTGYVLHRKGITPAGVVTFGSPRLGGLIWRGTIRAAGLQGRYERWVNQNDPVARVPFPVQPQIPLPIPTSPLWVHVGTLNYIDWEGRSVKFGKDNLRDVLRPAAAFGDHAIARYMTRIKELMPEDQKQRLEQALSPTMSLRSVAGRAVTDEGTALLEPVSMMALFRMYWEEWHLEPNLSLRRLAKESV